MVLKSWDFTLDRLFGYRRNLYRYEGRETELKTSGREILCLLYFSDLDDELPGKNIVEGLRQRKSVPAITGIHDMVMRKKISFKEL